MKKQDLKPGMLLIFSDNTRSMIVRNEDEELIFVGDGKMADIRNWGLVSQFDDDLNSIEGEEIVEIYSSTKQQRRNFCDFENLTDRTLLWKREPAIKIDQYQVEFLENSIKVGCTKVSHKIVDQIYNKIHGK
jgi:hypothetical protein